MEELFKTLRCFECKKYLSILPVKVYPNKFVKCGRCSSDAAADDAGIVSELYGKIAENLQFPCINRYKGCTRHLIPKEMILHEEFCSEICNNKSKVSCPICKELFTDYSLVVVEHFQEKHSERFLSYPMLNINLNDKHEEMLYLCVNPLDNIAKIIKIRYDHIAKSLNVDLAEIGKSLFQHGKFELNNIENKSIHKCCTGYSAIDLNQFPGNIVMCKILFESSSDNNENSLSSKNSDIPNEDGNKCKGLFLADSVIRTLSEDNFGTSNISLEFSMAQLKLPNQWQKSDIFYVDGTSWYFLIQRKEEAREYYYGYPYNNNMHLNCCLQKREDPTENRFSFQLNGTITINSTYGNGVTETIDNKIFGYRVKESNNFTLQNENVINLPNGSSNSGRQIKDLSLSGSINVKLSLRLTEIFLHAKSCKCNGCK